MHRLLTILLRAMRTDRKFSLHAVLFGSNQHEAALTYV